MRIGLISDIHGNLVALEAVLKELTQEQFDRLICLGDVAALGPQPHEVIARLQELGCPVVMGNTDFWLLDPPPITDESMRSVREILYWGAEQLTAADQEYIRAFSPTLEIELDEKRNLLCYHGSPRSFDDVVSSVTPVEDMERMFAGYDAAVRVGGHTHIQMIRRYGDAHFVNVGSIGLAGVNAGVDNLPRNRGVKWAEYGIIDLENGRLSIELRRTPLNVAAVLQSAKNSNMPHLEWWLQKWEQE